MRLREFLELGVKLNKELNPKLWDNFKLKPEVAEVLDRIADNFIEFLDIDKKYVTDVIITGSNCAFTYTDKSDIDLHLVINQKVLCKSCPSEDFLADCFHAKKSLWNDNHDVQVHGYQIEVYAQPEEDNLVAKAIYSLRNSEWIKKPKFEDISIDQEMVEKKSEEIIKQIDDFVENESDDIDNMQKLKDRLYRYRQSGLDKNGELGIENIVFKTLRSSGILGKLNSHIKKVQDKKLSF